MARVTIQDLADRLGLSKFSVSRALSGKGGVSESTRNKVLRTAHAMGYRVSHELAQTRGQILFIRQDIDPVTSELWLNVLHGAEHEGERLGLTIMPRQARHLLESTQVDPAIVGIILAVPRPADIADLALRSGLPTVCVNYVRPLDPIDQIVGADWESGLAVARMLTGLGHRRLAFAHGDTMPVGRGERLRGFRDGAAQCDGTVVEDLVFDESGGFRDVFLDLVRHGGPPTAIFCAHDGIAVTVVSELLRLGVKVPEDISVVGFNDLAVASQIVPALTTVHAPMVEMGAAAVRCIADRLASADAEALPPLRMSLATRLVERQSTCAPSDGSAASPLRSFAGQPA